MRERRYVKFRVDMLSDTKSKIIDMKPERDMIHYVWIAFVLLAGRVNLEGNLYMSKNLPYTIETLAIEFNRSWEQIKLALDIFIELEMMELIDGRIYRVKNFAKHQNIKVEKKVKSEDKEVSVKNREAATKAVITNEFHDDEEENNVVENAENPIRKEDKSDLEVNSRETNKETNLSREIMDNISQNNIPIPIEMKKNKKAVTKKKKEEIINVTDEEENGDDEMFCFSEGEFIPGEGDKIIASWTF